MIELLVLAMSFTLGSVGTGVGVYTLITVLKAPNNSKLREELLDLRDELATVEVKHNKLVSFYDDLKDIVEKRYSRMAARESRRNKEEEAEEIEDQIKSLVSSQQPELFEQASRTISAKNRKLIKR